MDHHTTNNRTRTQAHSPNPNPNPNRAEAERLLAISEKLLNSRDLTGSREFALLSQETEPLLEGSDQILAITDVLLASEKRVNNNRNLDYYSILQTDRRSEPDVVKSNYRRLAILLNPEKNHHPFADMAFKVVADAWSVLSDPSKRIPYDQQLSFEKDKLPVRRGVRVVVEPDAPGSTTTPHPSHHDGEGGGDTGEEDEDTVSSNFWTACPYCYVLYEYPKLYKECCLKCQNCERAFHGAAIPSLPPIVPGKEGYYCCWGFFPLGLSVETVRKGGKNVDDPNVAFPNWMPGGVGFTPPVAAAPLQQREQGAKGNVNAGVSAVLDFTNGSASYRNAVPKTSIPGAKKRGRPKKNPLGF